MRSSFIKVKDDEKIHNKLLKKDYKTQKQREHLL